MTTALLPNPVSSPATTILTEAEFLTRHGDESHIDLIDGVVVRYPMPGLKHGVVGVRFASRLLAYVDERKTGRVAINDTFVRVGTDPDRVRGADVLFLSHAKLPADAEIPDGVCPVAPEFVAEVKSPSDTWLNAFTKVLDYLDAGVRVVLVLDPGTKSASVFRADALQETFLAGSDLVIPDLFPGFAVPVAPLFQ